MSLSQDQPPRQTGRDWRMQRKVPKGSVPVVGELQGAMGWKPRWECLSSPLVAFVCSNPVSSSFPDNIQDGLQSLSPCALPECFPS